MRHSPNRGTIWAEIRTMGGPFTLSDLRGACPAALSQRAVRRYVQALAADGVVQQLSGCRRPTYRLVRDEGLEAPLLTNGGVRMPDSGRQRIWVAIKALRDFDARDVAMTAEVSRRSARGYLGALAEAEYLARMIERPSRHQPQRYRLLPSRNTGPLAPVLKIDGTLFDPNTRKTFRVREVADDRD